MSNKDKNKLELSDSEVNAAIRMSNQKEFGVLSSSFLSKSIGMLNPKKPLCVKKGASLEDVLSTLQKYSIGSVLVVDEIGKLAGIFTERDSLLKVIGKNVDLKLAKIDDIMTANPQTQKLDSTIAFALNLMSLGGFRHIPIVDDDHFPIGIISVKDIVDYIVNKMNDDLLNLTL